MNKLNVDQPRKKAEAEVRDYLSSERKSKARAPEKVVVHIKSDLNTKCKSKATPLKSIKKNLDLNRTVSENLKLKLSGIAAVGDR